MRIDDSNENKRQKKNGNKKSTLIKMFSFILVLLLVLISVYLIVNWKNLGSNPVSSIFKNVFSDKSGEADNFSFEAYSNNVFDGINGGLAVASSSAYQIFDASGNKIADGTGAFSSPAVSGGDSGAFIWDQGGTEAVLVNTEGKSYKIDTQNSIISSDINDAGWVAVATEESGYKGLVTIYDNTAQPVYKWYSGEEFLVDAAVAPSSTAMTALTVDSTGSRVVSYALNSSDEQGSYELDNIYFDISYISENRICAVSQNKAVFLNGNCEFVSEYNFEGGYLKDFSLDGNGYAVFVIGKYRTGGGGEIVSVDPSGKVLGTIEINSDINSVDADGKNVAVVYSDKITLYNSELKEIGTAENTAGTEKAVICSDRSLLAVSGYGAVKYKF